MYTRCMYILLVQLLRGADGWAKWAAINRHELLKRHKRGGFEGYPVRHFSRTNLLQGALCFHQIMFKYSVTVIERKLVFFVLGCMKFKLLVVQTHMKVYLVSDVLQSEIIKKFINLYNTFIIY